MLSLILSLWVLLGGLGILYLYRTQPVNELLTDHPVIWTVVCGPVAWTVLGLLILGLLAICCLASFLNIGIDEHGDYAHG